MSKPELKTDSLAYALSGAAAATARVRAGSALPQALAAVFAQKNLPATARGAIQDIAYRTQRARGRCDALLALMTDKPTQPPLLNALLCCALALLSEPEDVVAAYATFTVVDQAVTATAADRSVAHAKGMVNAVLRRFVRERAALLAKALRQPEAAWNYPTWWINEVRAAYPQTWQSILQAGNAAPPLSLRVNQRRSTVSDYLGRLAEQGIDARPIGDSAVRLARALPVHQIPGFDEGVVSVQDAAAQLAAPLLDVRNGMRVLDACAAPGGKTGHLLELAEVELLALDHDALRLQRIEENLQRLQLRAQLRQGDASRRDWWDGEPFDRILADVPCTASGIVRRHPDIRWLRRPEDAAQLALVSAKIIDNLWDMLRPGGKLLFVTCSLWPQESALQADAFEQRHTATRLAAPGQLLPTAQASHDHDGLFYALFQKPSV